jgi:LPXTG-motif cell wall-anchored protein
MPLPCFPRLSTAPLRRIGVTVLVTVALVIGPIPGAVWAMPAVSAAGELPDSGSTSLIALVIAAAAAFVVGASALIVRRRRRERADSDGDRR